MIHYQVDARDTNAHLFHVEMTFVSDADSQVYMPAWSPGSYNIRNFARYVSDVSAHDHQEHSLPIKKVDEHTWALEVPPKTKVCVRYSVYARERAPHGLYLDDESAFISGARLFFALEGHENEPCTLHLQKEKDWDLATTMPREGQHYIVANYRELIDHPLQMGAIKRLRFSPQKVSHELVFTGFRPCDEERLLQDSEKICVAIQALFENELPFDRYLFLTTLVERGYGGLEHRSSTHLVVRKQNLPARGRKKQPDAYFTFLGLLSHEYFHAWWVKKVRPKDLVNANLRAPVHTSLLWVFEGFTAYYDDLILARCGVLDASKYFSLLAKQITRVSQSPGQKERSLTQSSFDTWFHMYQVPENAGNRSVSYYAKGAMVALAIDLRIRRETQNARSLDDVLRSLYQRCDEAVTEEIVRQSCNDVCGTDLSAFFERCVDGTSEPELVESFNHVGLRARKVARKSLSDLGGGSGSEIPMAIDFGARLQNTGLRLAFVQRHGAAERAGLCVGDVLVALDNERITRASLPRLLANYAPKQSAEIHVFRNGVLRTFTLRFEAPLEDTWIIDEVENPSEAQLCAREYWLLGTCPVDELIS